MSNYVVLRDFEPEFDLEEISRKLRIKPGRGAEKSLQSLIAVARELARPKAVFMALTPEIIDENRVLLEGVEFNSNLLSLHLDLEASGRAFPYVASCGLEMADWARSLKGLEQFLADELMIVSLRQAVSGLEELLKERFELSGVSAMNPGSLPNEWPITAQAPLFELLGEAPAEIGVRLLPSLLMDPGKSVSGIMFQTQEKFHSCQLCPKDACPSRRSPYQGDGFGLGC